MSETFISEEVIHEKRVRSRLLVEGIDDLHVCYHLLKCHNIEILERDKDKSKDHETVVQGKIEILPKGGIENLLLAIRTELARDSMKHLGILVDADEDVLARWQSLHSIFVNSGYSSTPAIPDRRGTIIREQGKPAVGIWIMPDNQLPGMLEHFCRFLVPTNDQLWKIAENGLQQAMEQDRRFPEQHTVKAHLHTWLAWQEEPGKPIGQAITKRYFDHEAPHAQLFVRWIRELFEVAPSDQSATEFLPSFP
jgi:hypothetical protein